MALESTIPIEHLYKVRTSVLKPEQCEDIISVWDGIEKSPAKLYNDRIRAKDPNSDNTFKDTRFRGGEIAWLRPDDCPHWTIIRDEMLRWNFEKMLILNGTYRLQLTKYQEGDGFKKHQDVSVKQWSNMTEPYSVRKMSATLQLSDRNDYEGGEFLFFSEKTLKGSKARTAPKGKGDMFMFPSYCEHEVRPVTKGTRWALVVWAEGPYWR